MKCSSCGKEISGINKIVAIHGTIDNPLCSECATLKKQTIKSKDINNKTTKSKDVNNITTKNYGKTEGGFWSFDKIVSGSIIKVLYVLGAISITIFSFIMLYKGSQARFGGSTIILLALVYLILGNLLWRIACEGIIIIFKIFEKLNQIESKIK